MLETTDAKQGCSFADAGSRNICRGEFSVTDVCDAERAEPKGMCISLLRDEAVLRRI